MAAFASLALVGVLLVGPAASAASAQASALELLDRGIGAFRAGDYRAAEASFEGARRLEPSRANAYRWLGFTEVKLGDCARALLDFETFLRAVPATDERVSEVIRQRNECRLPRAPAFATAPIPPPSSQKPKVSIARRWWFWTALGVLAAGAAAGIALGVVYGPSHTSRLPSIVCDSTGCKMTGLP